MTQNTSPRQSTIRWSDMPSTAIATPENFSASIEPCFTTNRGVLFSGDCLEVLPEIETSTVDTVFADPPFNIGKIYGQSFTDKMSKRQYIDWCKGWLRECYRVLKPGGALFLYNLPKWNIPLGAFLDIELGMTFRHWIAIEMSASMPIPGRLHPSHYSLLYMTKGKPNVFRKIRTPIPACRHCGGDIKDYGGHRKALNPNGLNLKDVWSDIPPVRHSKYKNFEGRKANALSTKMLDRVVEMSTLPGDLVLDPFGGSGTTFAVCEAKDRAWIGIEIDFCDVIASRLENDDLRHHHNDDFVEG